MILENKIDFVSSLTFTHTHMHKFGWLWLCVCPLSSLSHSLDCNTTQRLVHTIGIQQWSLSSGAPPINSCSLVCVRAFRFMISMCVEFSLCSKQLTPSLFFFLHFIAWKELVSIDNWVCICVSTLSCTRKLQPTHLLCGRLNVRPYLSLSILIAICCDQCMWPRNNFLIVFVCIDIHRSVCFFVWDFCCIYRSKIYIKLIIVNIGFPIWMIT